MINLSSIWVVGYFYTALGFSIGGFIAWILKGFQKKIYIIYSICAGLILGLLSFEIAPEAIELGNWIIFSFGFFVGVIIFKLMHKASKALLATIGSDKHLSLHTGILLILGISIDYLPLGMVLGSSQNSTLNLSILQAILLHSIPEGIVVFTALFMVGLGIKTWILLPLFVASPVAIGAYFANSLDIINPWFWSFSISLTVGILYMITVKEILTETIQDSPTSYVFLLALLSFGCIGGYLLLI